MQDHRPCTGRRGLVCSICLWVCRHTLTHIHRHTHKHLSPAAPPPSKQGHLSDHSITQHASCQSMHWCRHKACHRPSRLWTAWMPLQICHTEAYLYLRLHAYLSSHPQEGTVADARCPALPPEDDCSFPCFSFFSSLHACTACVTMLLCRSRHVPWLHALRWDGLAPPRSPVPLDLRVRWCAG